ncbi:MAG: T9SS type A sorting domain-containing protein, partial [Flavobacteriales bacterium]|nr:T9SS type A sorting domain-containing protein [Flavobacteriales bacterium]
LYTDISFSTSGSAIRDARWKLITFSNGQQRFYDLLNDPWEEVNLLPGGLDADEQLALDALVNACSLSTPVASVLNDNALNVYPNPARDQLTISAPLAAPVHVRLFDPVGALVLETNATRTVDLTALASGFYFVELQQEDRTQVLKVVKE